jgi:hypothetical protein
VATHAGARHQRQTLTLYREGARNVGAPFFLSVGVQSPERDGEGEADMKIKALILLSGIVLLSINLLARPQTNSLQTEVLRGWFSDEQCAKGRAESGTFTGTNPECAKRCVSQGKKIVFIDPEKKRVLVLANQDAGTNHVGDYVEIAGEIDAKRMTLHADSVKFLEKGVAMCEAKKPESK